MENRKTTRVTERRHYDRVPLELPVTIRYRGRLIPATAHNLSCGGMLLDARGASFVEHDSLELIFDLSSLERDVTLRGEIRRIAADGPKSHIGVQFINLFSLGHEAVTRFLKRHGGRGTH